MTSEGFYIESAATGRFRRYHGASDGDTRSSWRLPISAPSNTKKEFDVDRVVQFAFVAFLFLQGILSGLSLSALYEALASRSPEEFLIQYSANRANEMRRYFFIGISFCVTGSLCLLDENTISQYRKGGSTSKSNNMSVTLLCLYFIALLLTLLCSRVDVHMSNIAAQINDGGMLSNVDLQSGVHKWRGFSVPRSCICIAGWLVSCYRFAITRSNVQNEEAVWSINIMQQVWQTLNLSLVE